MSKEDKFIIYCMERYRFHKKISGATVADLFDRYCIYDFLKKYFESMHTMSDSAIIQDIDEYIGIA